MRRGLLISGFMVLAAVWLGPLPEMARDVFSAHMAMHMGVVAVAAPLLSLGLAGTRLDPVARRPSLFHPIVASVVELVIVWAWHAPGLHHFARSASGGIVLEQGMFLAAGLLVWLSAFGGLHTFGGLQTRGGLQILGGGRARDGAGADAEGSRRRAAAGVVGLLLTAMHMTLLGALLALASRPLYHADAAGLGLTPLEDQHLGGAIMLLVGGISYLSGGLWLTAKLLRFSSVEPEAAP